jgi:hypothetical protein
MTNIPRWRGCLKGGGGHTSGGFTIQTLIVWTYSRDLNIMKYQKGV